MSEKARVKTLTRWACERLAQQWADGQNKLGHFLCSDPRCEHPSCRTWQDRVSAGWVETGGGWVRRP